MMEDRFLCCHFDHFIQLTHVYTELQIRNDLFSFVLPDFLFQLVFYEQKNCQLSFFS